MRKIKRFLRKMEIVFDRKLGWFFTNGRKQDMRMRRIQKEIDNEKN